MNLKSLSKILIIRLSSLGDVILTTPVVRSLKKLNSELKIDFLIRSEYKDLLSLNPYLSELHLYPREENEIKNLMKSLEENRYELIIDLQNNLRSKRIITNLGVRSVKFDKKNIEKFLLVNFKINFMKDATQIPARYAEALDLNLDEEGLDLFTNKKISREIKEENNLIGFAPGSRHYTKMWPKEYYNQLGDMLSEANYKIVLFGGSSDKEICRELSEKIKDSINLCNDNDILQTASDMKKCKVLICNDSGMMHTACAAKVPVLVFFGSTVREFGFTPYQNQNLILANKSLSCRPCSHIGRSSCPKGHFKCMLEISPRIAFDKLIQFMNN